MRVLGLTYSSPLEWANPGGPSSQPLKLCFLLVATQTLKDHLDPRRAMRDTFVGHSQHMAKPAPQAYDQGFTNCPNFTAQIQLEHSQIQLGEFCIATSSSCRFTCSIHIVAHLQTQTPLYNLKCICHLSVAAALQNHACKAADVLLAYKRCYIYPTNYHLRSSSSRKPHLQAADVLGAYIQRQLHISKSLKAY